MPFSLPVPHILHTVDPHAPRAPRRLRRISIGSDRWV